MSSTRTAVLAHHHALVRSGLRALLEQRGVRVVGESGVGGDAVEVVRRTRPDVVVMALDPGGSDALKVTRQVAQASPDTRLLVLGGPACGDVVDVLLAGASGYLLDNSAVDELVGAMEVTASGGAVLCPPATEALVERLRAQTAGRAPTADELDQLSEREREVLGLLVAGHDVAEIAERLFLSPHTVKAHVGNVVRKLGARNRVEAAVRAVRWGIV